VSANGPAGMDRVDIIEFGPDHRPVAHILAQSATFDPRTRVWLLKDGKRQTGLRPHDPITTAPVDVWETDIGPQEIALYHTNNFADFLATSQIDALLQHPRNYGMVPLLRVKHWRVVQPLANIIILLLAVPCVLTREPRTVKMAAAKTVLLTGAFVCAMFIAHQLARKPPTAEWSTYWPALVLWTPLFIFGPLAVYLLDRVKT
jgi:lipopolysaccharide export LptBFGC system permease protein LptF